jgi:aryl sulfotransferase
MRQPVRYHSIIADNARWAGFSLREGDIIISTPPKCGTTWTQMICAMLIFQTPDLERPLDQISPWLDQLLRPLDSVVADLEAQEHRRFIKTHTPLDGLPFDSRVTYIVVGRDPRDVALSWDNHWANLDFDVAMALRQAAVGLDDLAEVTMPELPAPSASERDRFWFWVGASTPPTKSPGGLAATLHHLSTFFAVRNEPNVVLLHYGDLKEDLEGQMRQLAARLSIDVPEERWPELVKAATFEEMKRRAKATGPNQTECLWRDGERFFHRARHGEWRALLDEDDLLRYEARVHELADAELSAWVHRGSIAPAQKPFHR